MKLAVLFSGGKDSTLAALTAKEYGHELSCLISVFSKNRDSYMFHTPSIARVENQAQMMGIPLLVQNTLGEKEEELKDLEKIILRARAEYGVEGIVTGAVESVYQASRVQKICNKYGLECFNPLWQRDSFEILGELARRGFEVVVVGVSAYPLDKNFLGKRIDGDFIQEMKRLHTDFGISPTGEGGEYESFVLWCPLFTSPLKPKRFKDVGAKNSWRREVVL